MVGRLGFLCVQTQTVNEGGIKGRRRGREKGEGVLSKTGCDGEIARAVDPNKQYTIKIALLQTSATSKWLRSMYKKDKSTGDGMFPALIKDLKGGQVFSADDAWVQKQPSFVRGKDTNNLEWSIETGEAEFEDN